MKAKVTRAGGKIPPSFMRKAEAKTARPKGGGKLGQSNKSLRATQAKAWKKA